MRKALLILIGGMLLATSTASAQDLQADGQTAKTRLWTLQACIDYALENNISLQKSKLQKQSATEDLKGAKGADGERIDQPESRLSALEGQWCFDGDQWYGEHQGR